MSAVLLCQATALRLPLRDASVHCVVTSPPYYGLRDYGTGTWAGGDPACTHARIGHRETRPRSGLQGGLDTVNHAQEPHYKDCCGRCGAVRVDQQLGLEDTPEAYIATLAQVFREVWRVLRDDGTCWVNIGDAMRDKQLLGLPWRLALALQADGWVLRSEIIWHKLNPMPESVQDRPTKAHEPVFLFSKQARYYYDGEAVKEAVDLPNALRHNPHGRPQHATPKNTLPGHGIKSNTSFHAAVTEVLPFRNSRTVWALASEPTPYAHFATFPTALVRRCLLAGCPPGGIAFDPLCGSGTTLLVARELGHHAVGVDLSAEYLRNIARVRLGLTALHEWENGQSPRHDCFDDLPLFAT